MALNEQMQQMVQQDIQDAETRPKEEILKEQMEGLKTAGRTARDIAVESIPGVSEALAEKRVDEALQRGDTTSAIIEGAAGLMGAVPMVGDAAAKGLRAVAAPFKKTRKAYKVAVQAEDKKLYPLFVNADKELPVGTWIEAEFPKSSFKGKRTAGSEEKYYVPTKGAKRTKGEKTKNTGDPIIIPDEATRKNLIDEGFITERTKRTKEAPYGKVTAVAARPGLHASQAPVATHLGPQDLKVTKKEVDKLLEAGVTPEAIKRRGNQYYVKRRAEDQVFVEVEMADDVDYQSMLAKEGKSDINDYVPRGGSYRYSDGQADSDQWVVGGDMKITRVLSREEAKQAQKEAGVVDLPYRDEVEDILGRKFSDEIKMAKGGVAMDDYLLAKITDEPQNFARGGIARQMELFEPVERGFDEGGLMEEGGMVDEESGNEVPPGSLREEVRDDIPAQLSEGEFVFPADVVRYIGLENLMRMRQEAKQGLAQMEAMGQMGNGDEAVMPDDLPFDMYDLDVDDEEEYNSETRNYQVGGYVPPSVPQMPYNQPTQVDPRTGTYTLPGTGIAGYQVPSGTPTGYTPYGGAQPYFQPVQFTGAQYQTALQTSNLPTFAETIGSKPGQYDELRTYINDAGQTLQIPFKDGRPIYPIPEGYRPIGDQPAPEEEQTTVTPTLGETTVRDEGGGDGADISTDVSTAKAMSSLGFTKSDESVHANAFGGHATFGASNKALRDATLEQAKAQLGSLSIHGEVANALGLTNVSSNDVAVAGNLGQQAALSAMGLNSNSQFGFSEQATMVGNVMSAAHEAAKQGKNVAEAIEAAIASPEHQAAITQSAISHMQDLGYTSSQINDPAAVAAAAAAYGAKVAGLQAQANEVQSKGTVRSARTGKAVTNKGQPVMTAKARAQLNAINEEIARTTAKAKAIAVQDPRARAAMAKGNIERGDAVIGTPTQADVSRARAAADAAHARETTETSYGRSPGEMGGVAPSPASVGIGQGPPGQSGHEGGGGGQGGSEAGDPSGGAGEGSGTDCLTESMKVKLNGVIDFVTNIKVGDIIDGSVVKEVLHKHMRSGYFVINNELEITNDHPVLANGTWTKPEQLYIGDYINDVKVESIQYIDRMTPTVSIVIDGDSFDVYTEGNTYTVHGRYKEVRQQAA